MTQSTKQRVLDQLLANEDKWLSGDTLATTLGVTRETVWKAINSLRKTGHEIESRKGQGYRHTGRAPLDVDAVRYYGQLTIPLVVSQSVTSTQSLAKEYLSAHHQPAYAAFVANEQTQGYGRRGRDFYSPADSGLYLSLILPNTHVDLSKVGLLTTGVADAVANVLEHFFPEDRFMLKWVNDVWLNGRKVAGIITEAALELESASSSAFIVGVGLNLSTADFPAAINTKAGAITSATIDRNELAAALINAIIACHQTYTTGDFLADYRQRSALMGRQVTLNLGKTAVSGQVSGISDDGGIIITTADGTTHTYTSGEVVKVQY
ncbi:biotin--[acetyl-CoA-carboxylase] ligase [Lacticaseibacillus pabuli]|uniref:Bifunctional ligase/repressor BirA n=1 Tax=Lacticaseibacillus pabuli TaxID=3025672 RepID=A0ABY7WUM4_9LACO|nr:biotin--[acetyl-CoA-carboxylase] ligase [Lacticaseibacillus sp. KACC 23028]WDF83471.1 biotin--[acetyl-CoA-carboxylase] ligase [Lacticaseibacillus sp. KACC 23028]